MDLDYLNFDLTIEPKDEKYVARVLRSPVGEAEARFSWPFSEQDLEVFVLRIGQTRRGTRRMGSPEMGYAKDFGRQLYRTVFDGQVGTSLMRSLDEADRMGKGLRLRFHLDDAPNLRDVPWEYLYIDELNRFLVVSTETPLVRYIDLPRRIRPLAVTPPLQVLVVVSNPRDVAKLDVEEEWNRLSGSLRPVQERGLLNLERLDTATLSALQDRLRRGYVHILHFIGHGVFEEASGQGALYFEDEAGRAREVTSEVLGAVVHDHRSLRLAVLNSCEGARSSPQDPFSGVASGLVAQGLPAVIAMQFEITDQAAIAFAQEFYEAIADGYPVDAALAEARKTLYTLGNDVEWGTPVLHMRAADGRIFDIDQSAQLLVPPLRGPGSTNGSNQHSAEPQVVPDTRGNADTDLGGASKKAHADPERRWPLWLESPQSKALAVLVAILVVAFGFWVVTQVLPDDSPTAVPSVTGLLDANATAELEALGIVVTTRHVASDTVDAGVVIAQDPAPNTESDEVTLTVSSGPSAPVVPGVTGLSEADATTQLEALGIVVTTQRVESDTIEEGVVISQDPEGGEDSGEVTLTVSNGPKPLLVLSVTGLSESDARGQLEDLGIVVTTQRVESDAVEEGVVISQDPEAGAESGAVTLTVSDGPPPPVVVLVIGLFEGTARAQLEALGIVVTTQPVESDEVAEGIVVTQDPEAGVVAFEVRLGISTLPPPSGPWRNMPSRFHRDIEAAVSRDGAAYFFKDNEYVRFTDASSGMNFGYPIVTAGNWKGMPSGFNSGVDAGMVSAPETIYFFDGSEYVRFTDLPQGMDSDYPVGISANWRDMPSQFNSQVDAALDLSGSVYLFSGREYVRFSESPRTGKNPLTGGVIFIPSNVDGGFPRPINSLWTGLPASFQSGIDAAVGYEGAVYMFKGDEYVRFSGRIGRMDAGYPKKIDS